MVPSVIAASAVQINVMVNSGFASFVGKEAVSWLNFAFRLMQLPIGVFGVAVATITLPVVSRIAAHVDRSEFGPTLGKAMRLAVFLTLPSAVGLYFLARTDHRHHLRARRVQTLRHRANRAGPPVLFPGSGRLFLHQGAFTGLLRHRQEMDSNVRELCSHRAQFLPQLSFHLPPWSGSSRARAGHVHLRGAPIF